MSDDTANMGWTVWGVCVILGAVIVLGQAVSCERQNQLLNFLDAQKIVKVDTDE
jgi:hypothetical protein